MGVGAGRKSRAKSHERRMREKAARKAARRALYESWRDAGRNSKSKRALAQARKAARVKEKETRIVPVLRHGRVVMSAKRVHAGPDCGNAGCPRCSQLWADLGRRAA